MTDKELADKVVALGVVTLGDDLYYRDDIGYVSVVDLLEAWRVAGALMEKCLKRGQDVRCGRTGKYKEQDGKFYCGVDTSKRGFAEVAYNDHPVRAIIEACVEALSE